MDGESVGIVEGGDEAQAFAFLLSELAQRERDRRALADETLGWYKELSLIYEISDALSRVLEVDEVLQLVAYEAHRFLSADYAALFLQEQRRGSLEQVVSAGRIRSSAASASALEVRTRVIETGHAECVAVAYREGDAAGSVGAILYAPLRSGEGVAGVLQLVTDQSARWTAGDLKLATSLAANAASAISRAKLHRNRLHQQSLRSQIDRFLSPELLSAARGGPGEGGPGEGAPVAVLFCDLSGIATRAASPGRMSLPDALAEGLLELTYAALDDSLEHEAVVDIAQGEIVVGQSIASTRRGLRALESRDGSQSRGVRLAAQRLRSTPHLRNRA